MGASATTIATGMGIRKRMEKKSTFYYMHFVHDVSAVLKEVSLYLQLKNGNQGQSFIVVGAARDSLENLRTK